MVTANILENGSRWPYFKQLHQTLFSFLNASVRQNYHWTSFWSIKGFLLLIIDDKRVGMQILPDDMANSKVKFKIEYVC